MRLPNKINYTDQELRCAALLILTEHFGHANTLRFLTLQHADNADYAELRERLFEGLSASEVYRQAAAFWQKRRISEETQG